MTRKKDTSTYEITRLSLRRESVKTLGVRSNLKTGATNGPACVICTQSPVNAKRQ